MAKAKRVNSISVFFPCYNEAKNLPSLLTDFETILPHLSHHYELIVVNDGSTDATADVVQKLARQNDCIRLVNHAKNRGYGAAIQTGIYSARYDWIFFTDADNQFKAAELTQFIPFTNSFDAVIGYRINRAEGSLRAFNASLFKLFVDMLFRVHVKDIDCAFKLIKADVIQSLPLISNGAMISAELLYRLKKKRVSFKQIPVSHYPRRYGQPTGNKLDVIIKAGLEAFRLYTNIKLNTNHS